MKTIFCKVSNKRRKEFQIKTSIVENSGIREVWKEALYEAGKEHIKMMYQNQKMLADLYGDAIVDYKYVDGKIYMPFYNRECTLSDKMLHAISENNVVELKKHICTIRKFILGCKTNRCEFLISNEFVRIFGEVMLEKCMAVSIANIDLQPDNILVFENNKVKIIDYEWVFNFPVPEDFILYYALKAFVISHTQNYRLEELCDIAGIKKELILVYDNMIRCFLDYISIDEKTNIDYRNMGRFIQNELEVDGYLKNLRYKFPEDLVQPGDKIIVYGAGKVGIDYITFLDIIDKYKLVAWVDKRALEIDKCNVILPEQIPQHEYDLVVIAVLYEKIALEIVDELLALGIDRKKIVWKMPI